MGINVNCISYVCVNMYKPTDIPAPFTLIENKKFDGEWGSNENVTLIKRWKLILFFVTRILELHGSYWYYHWKQSSLPWRWSYK